MNAKVYLDVYHEPRTQEEVVELDTRGENKENSVQEEQIGSREEKIASDKTKEIRDISTYTSLGSSTPVSGHINLGLVSSNLGIANLSPGLTGSNPGLNVNCESAVQGTPVYTRDNSTQPMLQGTQQIILRIQKMDVKRSC